MRNLAIPKDSKPGRELVAAIKNGSVQKLSALLSADSGLAQARIVDKHKVGRSTLHIASDWPGHIKNARAVVETLVKAGADVNARLEGPNQETPLHWAASNDDVITLDALLDNGADIEISGAIFTGGSPMSDAVVFAQWKAARRLLERGAKTTIWQAAALGLVDRVRAFVEDESAALTVDDLTNACWNACRGGSLETVQYLTAKGADINRVGHDDKTPLVVARESKNKDLIAWLAAHGAR